jgi:hypothetical protein
MEQQKLIEEEGEKGSEKQEERLSTYQRERKLAAAKSRENLMLALEKNKLMHARKKELQERASVATPIRPPLNVQDTESVLPHSVQNGAVSTSTTSYSPLYSNTVLYDAGLRLLGMGVSIGASMVTSYLLARALTYCDDYWNNSYASENNFAGIYKTGEESSLSESDEDL